MSSLVISGDTSGSVTLQAPAVSGTTTLTLPSVSGTVITTGSSGQVIPKAALPTGSVLQVVATNFVGTSQSTTSTSFVSTTFSASITPSNASSKILILFMGECYYSNISYYSAITVYRNSSTNLATSGADGMLQNNSASNWIPISINWIDSPSTTSSTTYTIYHRTYNSGTASVMGWGTGANCSMTLMEIAA